MLVPIALTAALLVVAQAGDPAASDLDALRGTWDLVAMETEGHEVAADEIKGRAARYEGNRLTLLAGAAVRRRSLIVIDPTATPKAINTWDRDGPYADQTLPGIYALDGETLKVAFARPGDPRPAKFTSKEGSAFLSLVYKRRKS